MSTTCWPSIQLLCSHCAADSPTKTLTRTVAMRIFKLMSAENDQVSVSSFALKLKHMGLDDADANDIIKSMDPNGTGRITCVGDKALCSYLADHRSFLCLLLFLNALAHRICNLTISFSTRQRYQLEQSLTLMFHFVTTTQLRNVSGQLQRHARDPTATFPRGNDPGARQKRRHGTQGVGWRLASGWLYGRGWPLGWRVFMAYIWKRFGARLMTLVSWTACSWHIYNYIYIYIYIYIIYIIYIFAH